MDELLSEFTEIADRNALTAAAYFHAKFEKTWAKQIARVSRGRQKNK